jgi:transcriptional regulator with XRE-family HTH domain
MTDSVANSVEMPAPEGSRPAERDRSTLGERLRHARVQQGLSLRELARRLEVSPSLVSQIETAKIQPSVRTLYAIVTELGVSLDEMFAVEETPAAAGARGKRWESDAAAAPNAPVGAGSDAVLVQRAAERRAIDLEGGVRWERLAAGGENEVEFLKTTYDVGGTSSRDGALVRHNGHEYGIVLSGTLGIKVGFEDYILEPGDSISFESTIPHRLYTIGDEPVRTVWVVIGRYGGVQ